MSVRVKTEEGWKKVAGNASGGSGASSWAELSGKPFESIGQNLSVDDQGRLNASESGTSDYSDLSNKPQINNVELVGNKSLADLGALSLDGGKMNDNSTLTIQDADSGDNHVVVLESGKITIRRAGSSRILTLEPSTIHQVFESLDAFDFRSSVKDGFHTKAGTDINCYEGTVTAKDFVGTINGYSVNKDVPSDAIFTDTKDASSLTCTSRVYGGGDATTSVQTALSNLADALGTVNTLLEGAL